MNFNRHIHRLSRRRDFLRNRVRFSNKDLTFDKAEANSLDIAVKLMQYFQDRPWELPKGIYGEETEVQYQDDRRNIKFCGGDSHKQEVGYR